MVFPFVWAKYKWKFMIDRCKLSFPRPLAARFARPNRRACSQASCSSFSNFVMLQNFIIICILWKDGVNFKSKRFDNPMKKLTLLEHYKSPIMIFLRTKNLMGLLNVSEDGSLVRVLDLRNVNGWEHTSYLKSSNIWSQCSAYGSEIFIFAQKTVHSDSSKGSRASVLKHDWVTCLMAGNTTILQHKIWLIRELENAFQSEAIFTMTTFDYNYQNAFRFRF